MFQTSQRGVNIMKPKQFCITTELLSCLLSMTTCINTALALKVFGKTCLPYFGAGQ